MAHNMGIQIKRRELTKIFMMISIWKYQWLIQKHSIKWVKIIQIWQNVCQLFSNIADCCHILSLPCLKGGT